MYCFYPNKYFSFYTKIIIILYCSGQNQAYALSFNNIYQINTEKKIWDHKISKIRVDGKTPC